MPFVYDDIYEICKNRRFLIDWLQGKVLLGNFNSICDICGEGSFRLVEDSSYSKDGVVWRCTNRKCNKKISIREGSWFSKSHLLLEQIVKLTYYWIYDLPGDFISRELKLGSEHTIVDWRNFAREVCLCILQQDNEKIGGPGKIVEIDESKFGKRKYHRGKRVEGVWIFGGIERETKRCFFEVVSDRSAATLIPIIQKYVEPDTTIHSDCWKAYSSLEKEGYIHLTVNHSIEFRNKDTGACTNLIESTWNAVKKSLPKTGTQKHFYDGYLVEYCVRKKYLHSVDDKFLTFLNLIKRVSSVDLSTYSYRT
jgi:transposase-like protein